MGGYGDYFFIVLIIMLCFIGIFVRLVGGYVFGEFNFFIGLYVVKNMDVYMMMEVYFFEYGWFVFNFILGM